LEPKNHPQFAHPAEEEFAKILDFYNIDWEYERRTFALEWDEAGNVTMAFTPDFYLPDQDLYIELTTLRPSLATKKNYKQRRMAELYPEINLILLKRKTYESHAQVRPRSAGTGDTWHRCPERQSQ
jgi:hypoxanthine phosphoribosyltransferase